jgi:hypothetical protein
MVAGRSTAAAVLRRTTGPTPATTHDPRPTRIGCARKVIMNRTTIGGYQGPVDILSPDDVVIAQAACRYRAEADATGADHWSGRLHRIVPAEAVVAGTYRLRLDSGRQGDITIATVTLGSRAVHFEGVGERPV